MFWNCKRLRWAVGFLALACAACGSAGNVMVSVDPPDVSADPLAAPSIRLVSPPVWKAGEVVTILGADFVPPERGYQVVRFDGEFVEDGGQSRKVAMSVRAQYKNSGRIEFVFEPAYPPDGFGHDIGFFYGQAQAVNAAPEEQSAASEPLDVDIDIGPSLIVWAFEPEGGQCSQGRKVGATLDGQSLSIDLQAIGLTPATAYTPLTFTASYVDLSGTPQVTEVVRNGGDSVNLVIDPGHVPQGKVSGDVLVSLQVEDGHGAMLNRSMLLNVGLKYSIAYDGNSRIAELYQPAQVSGCLPGGEYGRDVSFTSQESESRSRTVGFTVNLGISLWVVNAGFSINVNETVSSAQSQSVALSGHIYAGQYGVFYRQTQRLERLGKIVERNRCGANTVVGDAVVTDWNWAPDLAVTSDGSCPPAPPSNLPPAQVIP